MEEKVESKEDILEKILKRNKKKSNYNSFDKTFNREVKKNFDLLVELINDNDLNTALATLEEIALSIYNAGYEKSLEDGEL